MNWRKLNIWLLLTCAVVCGVLDYFLKEINWALCAAVWVLYLIFYKEK